VKESNEAEKAWLVYAIDIDGYTSLPIMRRIDAVLPPHLTMVVLPSMAVINATV